MHRFLCGNRLIQVAGQLRDRINTDVKPVLGGPHDVAESEDLAAALRERGIAVSVLNAKNDAEEARIVAATAAVWLACQPEVEPPKQSAYETADLMIL